MPLKVSVVIPVYNPGPHIQVCVDSLLRQTMPPDEFEAVFVDDGSTDDTPALLDRLAAEHPNMHVIHQENHGWPGQPRNAGTDAAKGEYVYYSDHDDYFGDEALQRMYDYAVANEADIVVGKLAGYGRRVPRELFRENLPRATLADSRLIDSMTPHKLFRRAFLTERDIRFPEGRRRLEDHVFCIEAYLRAERISVLSDYVCYYHIVRPDEQNAAYQPIEPASYMGYLQEALDIVDRYTEPGKLRDKLYRRWLRVEMIDRLRGHKMLVKPPEYRKAWFDAITDVVRARFTPSMIAGLAPSQRVVAEVMARGGLDELEAYAAFEEKLHARAVLDDLHWDGEHLHVALRAELRSGKDPVYFRHEPADGAERSVTGPGRDLLVLPGLEEAAAHIDATRDLTEPRVRADLMLRNTEDGAEYYLPVETTADREPAPGEPPGTFRLVVYTTAAVDPDTAASGAPLDRALWEVRVRLRVGGWSVFGRPGRHRTGEFQSVPRWVTRRGRLRLRLTARPERAAAPRCRPDEWELLRGQTRFVRTRARRKILKEARRRIPARPRRRLARAARRVGLL